MKHVTLEDMLAARELRLQRQAELRGEQAMPLVAVTLNIPGPVKDGALLRRLCDYAVNRLSAELPVMSNRPVPSNSTLSILARFPERVMFFAIVGEPLL